MAENYPKTRGPLKGSTPTSGGAVRRTVPILGVVKKTVDEFRMGRVWVYLFNNSGVDADDPLNWEQVEPLLPYFGFNYNTSGTGTDQYGDITNNSTSWGMWGSPPEIGSTVVCIWPEGKPDVGYYIGVVPRPGTLRMVPGIGTTSSGIVPNAAEAESYGGAKTLPVINANWNNTDSKEIDKLLNAPSPAHNYAAASYWAQGTLKDEQRGPLTTSAERESPSRVGWGISTPGKPIYGSGAQENTIISRQGGHTLVMDDGNIDGRDTVIRIRTSGGHQIIMRDDDGQEHMTIMHSSGHYIELGASGTVDVWADNSVNIATNGDLNLHADGDVNINAGKNIRLRADEGSVIQQSKTSWEVTVDGPVKQVSTGDYTIGVTDGAYAVNSSGDASIETPGTAYIVGSSRVNLNTGSSSTTAQPSQPVKVYPHYQARYDETAGWVSVPCGVISGVSRLPQHFPWPGAGYGIDGDSA